MRYTPKNQGELGIDSPHADEIRVFVTRSRGTFSFSLSIHFRLFPIFSLPTQGSKLSPFQDRHDIEWTVRVGVSRVRALSLTFIYALLQSKISGGLGGAFAQKGFLHHHSRADCCMVIVTLLIVIVVCRHGSIRAPLRRIQSRCP